MSFSEHPAITKARRQAKEKMSVTQTFHLAHKARVKLSHEASRPDHDLRALVLTANLLDSLMNHLSQAEEMQDAWFNGLARGEDSEQTVEVRSPPSLSAIHEESELQWTSDDDSDSESDSDDEVDYNQPIGSIPMISSRGAGSVYSYAAIELDSESDSSDDDEEESDDGFYSLTRVPSNRPPALIEDGSDSEEEPLSQPPSPRSTFIIPTLSEKERQNLVTTSYYEDEDSMDSTVQIEQSATLIAAY